MQDYQLHLLMSTGPPHMSVRKLRLHLEAVEMKIVCKLIIDQLVGFLVVEPIHPVQVFDLAWVLAFSWIYSRFNGVMLSVVGDVPVDSEAHVVTS